MSSSTQTIIALAIVVVTLALLVRSALKKRAKPGCGCGDSCGAVTPEVKKLQAQFKR
jgi:hypothetical protein